MLVTLELGLRAGTPNLIRLVLAVIALITHILRGYAASVTTGELVPSTGAASLVLHVEAVPDVVTPPLPRDALPVTTVPLLLSAGQSDAGGALSRPTPGTLSGLWRLRGVTSWCAMIQRFTIIE